MKNQNSKDKVLIWLRQAVSLNMDMQKMFTQSPVASQGFVLNYIDLLLQLCKPFIGIFNKYGDNLKKLNCFYLMSNEFVDKALTLEKIVNSQED